MQLLCTVFRFLFGQDSKYRVWRDLVRRLLCSFQAPLWYSLIECIENLKKKLGLGDNSENSESYIRVRDNSENSDFYEFIDNSDNSENPENSDNSDNS
jgi:hypothetical protein